MKKIILILLMMFFTGTVYAGAFWIINLDNQIIAKCDYLPDEADLESRNEVAIWCDKDIPFEEAEYRGNKIVKHHKTTAELKAEAEKAERTAEELLISERMRKIALDQLKAEGKVFKYIK